MRHCPSSITTSPPPSPLQEVLPLLSELLGHIDRFGQFLSELGGLYALLARAAR